MLFARILFALALAASIGLAQPRRRWNGIRIRGPIRWCSPQTM